MLALIQTRQENMEKNDKKRQLMLIRATDKQLGDIKRHMGGKYAYVKPKMPLDEAVSVVMGIPLTSLQVCDFKLVALGFNRRAWNIGL